MTLISDQSKVSECVLVVWTLDVSNLVRFGRGVICLREGGYVVASCNKVCYICNELSPVIVKWLKAYTR